MSFRMPTFYRVLFGLFDVLLPTFGVYGHIFAAKDAILAGFTGARRGPVWPPAPETRVLLDGVAGWYVALITLQIFAITKRPRDWGEWTRRSDQSLMRDSVKMHSRSTCTQVDFACSM